MFSLFLNIPPFLIWHFDEERDSCVYIYPEEWMAVGYNLLWDVLAFLPLVLMVVSYSRVVYTLWFKRNYDFQNNQHQMVRQLTTRHVYKTYLIITCVKHIYYNFLDLKCCFPQQQLRLFIYQYLGRDQGTKACHLNGRSCQCHIWNLLGHKFSYLHLKGF